MVKEQNLALNPTKISGICGRLMCCMFYEHSTYSELWKGLPNPGSKIKTPQGNYVLEGVDLHKEMVKISFPEGGEAAIPVTDFERFKETVLRGEAWLKEDKKDIEEPDRRNAFPRGGMSKAALEARGDSAKNKPRPEKISIEEHIAERVNAEKAHPEGTSPHPQPLQGQAPQSPSGAEGRTAAKKRHRRRKDAPSDSRKQEEQARTQGAKERHRPPDYRPKSEPAEEIRKGAHGGTQVRNTDTHGVNVRSTDTTRGADARSAGNRRRPKYKGGNRGHERHGTENAGAATDKGDS
jgi:hypothetical protein